jgi:hypothetical protein
MSEQAKQTPLVELLDAVPEDVRIGVQDSEDWNAGTTWHPVGRLCRDAAAELRRLHALNGELLEALKHAHTWLQGSEPGRAQYLGEIIAKAEAQP